ncbi:rna-directed dna polymerase from mobile element jockey-like protein, partial [Lasius niger]
ADQRMVTVSVFFDFSKAFDRVDHLILIRKLKDLNFSDSVLQWIYSYLRCRSQAVKDSVAGTMSSLTLVSEGVPQGSVLGPLLFTLYLSDFQNVLKHCKYNFYADDLQAYLHCKPRELSDAILKVNEDINAVINWSFANSFISNSDKTQAIIFGTSRYVNAIDLNTIPEIMVDMTAIQYSTAVKYLGNQACHHFDLSACRLLQRGLY